MKITTRSEQFQNPIQKSKKRGKIDAPNTDVHGNSLS
jgi:hypothetical protein